jgi:hypothetical protein
MFSGKKRKFLFKCDTCEMIVSVEFEEAEDIKKTTEDKVCLECPCGGYCKLLRD